MPNEVPAQKRLTPDTAILIGLSIATLLAYCLVSGQYGYFRDEFYYLACGEHLDWGYVDQPPFVALVAFLSRRVLGESLLAIRFAPALAESLVVLLTGLIARELGGGRFAQAFAALAFIVGPVYLIIGHVLSMNAFDHLFWALAVYVLVLILKHDRPRFWVLFGLIAGVGLMNKYSVGFMGLGLAVGLALTPARKYFLNKWLWVSGALALVIFLPHIIWEIQHGFPTREFIHNATVRKNLPMSPPAFLAESILQVHPVNFPVWLAGLYFCFFSASGKQFRVLAWIYVSVLGLLLLTNAKPYYLAPAIPMLLAAGAVQLESVIRARQWNWLKPASAAALALGGLFTLPYALPVLPVETFIRYEDFVGLHPGSGERGQAGKLPQMYADMYGWENQVATVARVYNSLTAEEKARTIIFCSNYGQAGAIDFFGKKYGLPKAVSGHNNYWYWGPGNWDADIVITVGESREDVEQSFNQVDKAAIVVSEYARPFETNMSIFIGQKPKMTLREIWPRCKDFI